ncbi:MAG TPA: hypothetical protein PLG22_04630 [Kiritimatiellia bacterium]|nr:hypothetical protein [Kiritimatiellia bacterium]
MKGKKPFLCLIVGGASLQMLVTLAATPAASVATATDVLIDTRINFVVRSAAPGTKIDTLTPGGTLIMVH